MDITEKIAALLNKAEDKGCTPEESEAFFSKAQALISKYQIDEEMVRQRRGASAVKEEMGTEFYDVPAMYEHGHLALWSAIAKANDVHLFTAHGRGGKGKRVAITGFKSDRETVKLLVVSMQLVVLREARAASKKAGGDYYFRRAFIMAFADRIGTRLTEQRMNALNAHKSETGSDMLPALINKAEAAKKHAFAEFDLRTSRGRGIKSDGGGRAAGREAANRADIGNSRLGGSHRSLGSGS